MVLLGDSYPILAESYDSGHPFVMDARLTISELGGLIPNDAGMVDGLAGRAEIERSP